MAIFGPPQAKHFCAGYTGGTGTPTASFRTYVHSFTVGKTFLEGTVDFDEYRDGVLREVERLLFLAACHYRRSFDLQTPSSSPWAYVTLYYGSYFAAQAILGMFGGWKHKKANIVIDVANPAAGAQSLVVRKRTSTYAGSHQQFWDYFYASTPPLVLWVDAPLRYSLTPLGPGPSWQIDARNDLNYDSTTALAMIGNFEVAVRYSNLRPTLPAVLRTQLVQLEGLLAVATQFAKEFQLQTDALSVLPPPRNRGAHFKEIAAGALRRNMGRHLKRRILR